MSVLIKDMQMPRTCYTCQFKRFDDIRSVWYCQLTDKALLDMDTRESHCPLIDISLRTEDDEACCADSW